MKLVQSIINLDRHGRYSLDAKQRAGLSRKTVIYYLLFVLLVFLAPILVSYLFSGHLCEIRWRNAINIAMLEWTSAFLNVFIFLLLLEFYRNSKETIFALSSCAFLVMGVMNFAYSLRMPGSPEGGWLKALSLFFGSLIFLATSFSFHKKDYSFYSVMIKYVLPGFLISLTCIFTSGILSNAFPNAFTSKGLGYSELIKFVFWVSGGFFMMEIIPWFHAYFKTGRHEFIVFSAILFFFAQAALIARISTTWDVLWWVWHALFALTGLFASLYLLSISVKRSLVWRLLLSLGLTFGLALVISSGIVQSVLEKNTEINFHRLLFAKHLKVISTEGVNIKLAVRNLKMLKVKVESEFKQSDRLSLNEITETKTNSQFEDFIPELYDNILEKGYFTGKKTTNTQQSPAQKTINDKLLALWKKAQTIKEPHVIWGRVSYCDKYKKWILPAAVRLDNPDKGILYRIIDANSIKNDGILKNGRFDENEGRLIMDKSSGSFIIIKMPVKYNEIFGSGIESSKQAFFKELIAKMSHSDTEGKIFSMNIYGRNYLLLSNLIPDTDLIMTHIIDLDSIQGIYISSPSKYLFVAVGMIALLFSFIILLLLLNKQLSEPLNGILEAVKIIDSGDFSIRINSNLKNELGILSNSFDRMASSLDELYGSLQKTIKDKSKALEDAEKACSARSAFFTNLSHDLRTPLHGILSFSRLGSLYAGKDSEKVNSYFESINECGTKLLNMINEVLELAQIKSGQMDFSFTQSSLYLVVIQIYEEMKGSFEENKINFACSEPEFDTNALFDREKIARVIRNLLGNAVKYSPQNGTVKVSFMTENGFISVSVEDDGPGIPENEINQIFSEFHRAQGFEKYEGYGLGLAISKDIISAHHGTIYASNSDKGIGSVFVFKIPKNYKNTSLIYTL